MNVYEIVTNKIIEKLEQGVIPWRKPWNNCEAVNWETQKPYGGINSILLEPGEYATFNKISEVGGKIKKGEKCSIVVFWKWLENEDEEGKTEKIPLLRYYKVWEINRQVEGLESRNKVETFNHNPIENAENIIDGFKDKPEIDFIGGRAVYKPFFDKVEVPRISNYKQPEEFYSTLFHELIHSTGHAKRLNRSTLVKNASFGDEVYSQEELVAEIGSSMLCNIAQIDHAVIDNQVSYINSWLSKLKKDKSLIIKASGQAQKAVNYILNKEGEKETA
ncbi:MAG: ArdC family protein [Vulcanibacillus sp.]